MPFNGTENVVDIGLYLNLSKKKERNYCCMLH